LQFTVRENKVGPHTSIVYFKYLKIILLALCYTVLQQFASNAAPVDTAKKLFSQLTTIPEPGRAELAIITYKTNLRKKDQAFTMACLDYLTNLGKQLDDKHLQWAVINMRADYYSVNFKLNTRSTRYYLEEIDFAERNEMPVEASIAYNNIAAYFFIYKDYVDACRNFLLSQEKFKQIGFDNIPNIDQYLSYIGSFYYNLGDYDNAKIELEDALKYSKPLTRDRINYINTIGLIYRSYKQFPLAINKFYQALNIAAAIRDTIWIGITKGNIGSCYFLQGQYQRAIPYIENDYKTSLKFDEPANGAIALLRMVKINIDYRNYMLAGKELDSIASLLKNSKEDVLKQKTDYYNLKSALYEQLGLVSQSIEYRKIYEENKDSIIKRDNLIAVERVQIQYEADKNAKNLGKLAADIKITNIEINAGAAVIVLLLVISVLVYNRQRMKSKKDKALLLAEKQMIDERLKNARIALHRFTENIRQKNKLIENFKQEIEKLNTQSVDKSDASHLEKLLQAHIMTNETWGEFKRLFSKVYPGFFVNLSKQNPNLSTTDTRIMALIKLGLSNAEMANMLGITVEGIKKAKQRLRKKMDSQSAIDMED
jgi:tetratricopeptide (TPR) repeat protein